MRTLFGALLATGLLAGTAAYAGDLPDPSRTPGALNPDVTQSTLDRTICSRGWTKTIRPPASYTSALKKQQMAEMGLSGSPHDYEEDHLVSLELGGHPTDSRNLWPQLWDGQWGAHKKDVVETRLKTLVCNGKISLSDAQTAIRTNWIAAYQRYVKPN